jgi:hypothetical protein
MVPAPWAASVDSDPRSLTTESYCGRLARSLAMVTGAGGELREGEDGKEQHSKSSNNGQIDDINDVARRGSEASHTHHRQAMSSPTNLHAGCGGVPGCNGQDDEPRLLHAHSMPHFATTREDHYQALSSNRRHVSSSNVRVLQGVPPPASSPIGKELPPVLPRFNTLPQSRSRTNSCELGEGEDWSAILSLDESTKPNSTSHRRQQSSSEPEYEVGSVMWKLRKEPGKSSGHRKTSLMSATLEVSLSRVSQTAPGQSILLVVDTPPESSTTRLAGKRF